MLSDRLPKLDREAARAGFSNIKKTLWDIVVKDLIYTFLPFLAKKESAENETMGLNSIRLLSRHILSNVAECVTWACYLPVAVLLGGFEVITIIFLLALIIGQIPIGILLNAAYFLVNNFVIHVLFIGVFCYLPAAFFSLAGALFDKSARSCLRRNIQGLVNCMKSLLTAIKCMLFPNRLFSLLIGKSYLDRENKVAQEDEQLSLKQADDETRWLIGIKSCLSCAFFEAASHLQPRVNELFAFFSYALVLPAFATLNIVHSSLLACRMCEQTVISPIVMVTSHISNHLFSPAVVE